MKNGKRPTRRQKQAMESVKLNPSDWLVYKVEPHQIHVVNDSQETQIIPV
ncbi:DUF6906 family protein [Paenibacillus sp. NRS-1760]